MRHCRQCGETIADCECPDDEMAEGVAQAWHAGGDDSDEGDE